jgi:hypothetical protein
MPRRVFHVELPIRAEWDTIEPLRASVLACVRAVFQDVSMSETLSMIATELVENAVKYGDWTRRDPAARFTLRVAGDEDAVEVVVSNPVHPAAGTERLLHEVRRIADASSAEDVYLERMRALAATPGGEGGLGLARVAFEGQCELAAALGPDGVVEVRAVTRPTGAGRAPVA